MGEIEKLPARSEIAEADKWALEDLFLTDADWEAAVKQLRRTARAVKRLRRKGKCICGCTLCVSDACG